MTPNEVWNFLANGNTRLDPVHNNYFGSQSPMIRMPAFWSERMTPEQFHTGICGITAKKISLDGWKNRHDLPWEYPLKPHALDCDCTPVGPAGQQVFMHYVIWGLKHLLAETDYYRDFLVWDDQHRSWRLLFAFLPGTDVGPPVFFSCTWRKTEHWDGELAQHRLSQISLEMRAADVQTKRACIFNYMLRILLCCHSILV